MTCPKCQNTNPQCDYCGTYAIVVSGASVRIRKPDGRVLTAGDCRPYTFAAPWIAFDWFHRNIGSPIAREVETI